jgi:hypothetical protein
MPAVFMVPLPGLSELPLRDGLQTAFQSEVGVSLDRRTASGRVRAGARVFLHHYDGLMFAERFANPARRLRSRCVSGGTGEPGGLLCRTYQPSWNTSGFAYGAELEVRAELGPHFETLLTYTLAEVEANPTTAGT